MKMKDFIKRNKNTVFRYWERRTMWTPYEMELKDPDQLEYGDVECNHGYIVAAIDLGYDWLLGFSDDLSADYIEYHKLSNIELAYSDTDQER